MRASTEIYFQFFSVLGLCSKISSTKGNLPNICVRYLGICSQNCNTAILTFKVEAEMRGTLLLWPALLHGPGNFLFFLFFLIFIFLGIVLPSTIVTSISPDRIGYGGGTINIHGEGFATDGFSQFDPNKGNKVCAGLKEKRLSNNIYSPRSSLPTLTRRWSAKILSIGTSSSKTLP